MSSKNSVDYRPTYLEADELSTNLMKILSSEGYAVTQAPVPGPVMLLPIKNQQTPRVR